LLWLSYEVLALISMKAFGSSLSSHIFVVSSNQMKIFNCVSLWKKFVVSSSTSKTFVFM
jgi:hypothetical protein